MMEDTQKIATKIVSFHDLNAWKKGHQLVLSTYQFTQFFPKEEIYGLSSQLRRCIVSVTSNTAEGFGRRSKGEKVQFYNMALGSVLEFQNQILIARDLGYISETDYKRFYEESVVIHKLLNGLIKSVKNS